MEIFDYIVVGAGSAGCVVARRLSDDPSLRVLLLEAGPHDDAFWIRTPAGMGKLFHDGNYNWRYYTEPVPTLRNRKIYWPRGKVLGGSGSINGMIFIRGHSLDFDHWKQLGNVGWGYADLLPYFKRMEDNEGGADDFRGVGGPLRISDPIIRHPSCFDFIESASRVGIAKTDDINGAVHDGVAFMQHTIRDGVRESAYTAYIKPVRERGNLVVATDAHVERILFENREAVGVRATVGGQRRDIKAAREVIVSTGALNSPQLLMLSGIGEGAMLQRHGIPCVADLPGVGRNLQDHFYIHGSFRSTPRSSYNAELRGWRKYWQGVRYLTTRNSYLSLGSSQVAAFIKSDPDQEYANLQISFRPMTFHYHEDGRIEVDRFPSMNASVCLLRPSSIGHMTLRSPNASQAPAFVPNFLEHRDDVRAMVSGIRKIREIMSTPPVATRVIEQVTPDPKAQTDDQLLEYMQKHGNCAFHPVGTCKMGPDAMAVVDERLRVHGIGRLRVVDASIMPRVTAGNTNAPSIMIGEKGADLIREDALGARVIPN